MSFQFAHISDLHLPPLPAVTVGEVLNKRLLGWLSWHRKRRKRHRAAVVAALERLLGERRLDHICITGDLTNLGLAREFHAADQWLEKLATPDSLTFVPGNHDAYTAASVDAMGMHFGRWLPDRFPSVTRRNGITFIGVSSAVPTPPFAAMGRIGRGQMQRLASILDDTGREPAYRVLILHHPPRQGIVSRRKALTDATELQRVLHERPVDLVLHGHGHHAAQYQLPCAGGMVPVFGAGSATLSHGETARTGHFHVFRVDEDALRVTHYHYQPDRDCFVPGREQPVPRRPQNP